jgi:hypothetical protein
VTSTFESRFMMAWISVMQYLRSHVSVQTTKRLSPIRCVNGMDSYKWNIGDHCVSPSIGGSSSAQRIDPSAGSNLIISVGSSAFSRIAHDFGSNLDLDFDMLNVSHIKSVTCLLASPIFGFDSPQSSKVVYFE